VALDAAEALGGAEQAEGGELVADDIAGRKAEKLVYMHELKQVGKSLKKHGLDEKANQLVKWWRKEGLEYERYDIESARVNGDGKIVKLFLVKSSKARDFSSVRISSCQVEFAKQAETDGERHRFVFVNTGADGEPTAR